MRQLTMPRPSTLYSMLTRFRTNERGRSSIHLWSYGTGNMTETAVSSPWSLQIRRLELVGKSTRYSMHNSFRCRRVGNRVFEFSTNGAAADTTIGTTSKTGDDVYQEYLDLCHQLQSLKQEKERLKSQAMYEAWQRTERKQQDESKQQKSKNQGVAVVKTLVQQTRRESKKEEEPLRQLQDLAQAKLREAAFQYGHAQALVQIGNQALEEAAVLITSRDGAKEEAQAKVHEALDYYKQAGQKGCKEAWFNHGHLLWTGFPDLTTLSSDDKQNNREEQTNLSSTHNHDNGGSVEVLLSPDQQASLESFERAIQLGDTDAMYFVGVHLLSFVEHDEPIYNDDKEVSQILANLTRGLQLIQDAATGIATSTSTTSATTSDSTREPHSGALYYLALFMLNGHVALGIPPCGQEEFRHRLDAAVDAGHDEALFLRGNAYYHGSHGYSRHYGRALADFLRAADAGHADAAVSAGAMLHTGDHVPRDQKQAFSLYQHAGESGSLEGWRNVAACYATGQGVAQSMDMARHIIQTMKLDKEASS